MINKFYDKGEFLKLYRNILRCHRILQEPMKSMGDQYVKTEWRLHKKVEPKIASIFYKQWDQYLNILISQRDSILEQAMSTTDKKSNIGKELNENQIKKLNKKQLDQLNLLKSETTTVYKPSD